MTVKNTKINCGSDFLIPKSEWVSPDELSGEEAVLTHPIIHKAFNRILEDFTPQHDVAFLSLCTTTRPYNKSAKWKIFMSEFSNSCDLIVCSNGGVIPQKYWECYPFMTYDAPHLNEDWTPMYIDFQHQKLTEFFSKFTSYKKLIFNFRPHLRNRIAVERFLQEPISSNFEIHIVPSETVYERAKARGFNHGKVTPDLDDYVLTELRESIGIKSVVKNSLWG